MKPEFSFALKGCEKFHRRHFKIQESRRISQVRDLRPYAGKQAETSGISHSKANFQHNLRAL